MTHSGSGWQHFRWKMDLFAEQISAEYRKFLYLTQVAGHVVTPSKAIDEAWHLHLLYTRSYWDGLCGEVLGKPLHHEPGSGKPTETGGSDTGGGDAGGGDSGGGSSCGGGGGGCGGGGGD